MDIPRQLRIISIVLIVMGAIRLIAGILGLLGLNGGIEENENLVTLIIVRNFVASTFVLISGLLLLKGKRIGRVLLIATIVVSWFAIFMLSKEYELGSLVVFIAIIVLLFLEDSIKQYFSNNK